MAEVVFIFEGKSIIIHSNKNQKMKDICNNLSIKINIDINSLIFLYEGKQLDLNKILNEITKENKINILVYKYENEICSKCGRILNNKIIEDIRLINNNINYSLIGIKSQIENIMNDIREKKNINYINSQLNNINIIIKNINDDIEKMNNKLNQIKLTYNINNINKENGINKIKNDYAKKKILEEYKFIKDRPFTELPITVDIPDKDNVFEWRLTFQGPDDTSYKGGLFFLKAFFPKNFPEKAPEICFQTPIYHLNVNPNKPECSPSERIGHIAISILNWWKPNSKIRYILNSIYYLFYCHNPESPYGLDRAEVFINNRELFEKRVRYFTIKYANQINASQSYDEWDFSDKNFETNDEQNQLIKVIFETDGINRQIIQCKKDEYVKNLFLQYEKINGFSENSLLYIHKNIRIYRNLNKKLHEINIYNGSLISVINSKNIIPA